MSEITGVGEGVSHVNASPGNGGVTPPDMLSAIEDLCDKLEAKHGNKPTHVVCNKIWWDALGDTLAYDMNLTWANDREFQGSGSDHSTAFWVGWIGDGSTKGESENVAYFVDEEVLTILDGEDEYAFPVNEDGTLYIESGSIDWLRFMPAVESWENALALHWNDSKYVEVWYGVPPSLVLEIVNAKSVGSAVNKLIVKANKKATQAGDPPLYEHDAFGVNDFGLAHKFQLEHSIV